MDTTASTSNVQVQGHRGDRGNFPEKSIPAFISAVKKKVDFLELDLVISKDKKVVVSHEAYMSLYVFCNSINLLLCSGLLVVKEDELK